MTMICTNKEQYSKLWMEETELIEKLGIYEQLSKLTPEGKVLEFGCGSGRGTRHLLSDHEVLSLDGNGHLIEEAKRYIAEMDRTANIHECDFFYLSQNDKNVISTFTPKVIVGWFIGSCGEDVVQHTKEQPSPREKGKLYREKIEDIIVSPDVCLPSVEYIHLVSRGAVAAGLSDEFIFEENKKDYEKFVFGNVGFEVISVKTIPWPRDGSKFQYSQAHNPNFVSGDPVSMITSIIAKRVK